MDTVGAQPPPGSGLHPDPGLDLDAGPPLVGRLQVWIDQDLCTGDGICTDHAPAVFTILEDGIAYCQQGDRVLNDPGGAAEMAQVPPHLEGQVIHAAAECPGECIFVELPGDP